MEIIASTLDDLMNDTLTELLKHPCDIDVTKGKLVCEMVGTVLKLTNPLARISVAETRGKPFSAIGELLWYLSKRDDLEFITYYIERYKEYSDDGIKIHG